MSQLVRAVRFSGFGVVTRLGAQLGSQQVARRNAAVASAVLLRRREEREAVDAFVASRLATQLRPATRGPRATQPTQPAQPTRSRPARHAAGTAS